MFKVVQAATHQLIKSKKFLVVFDLDGTLTPVIGAVTRLCDNDSFHETMGRSSLSIDVMGYIHYISLGTLELLQLLDSRLDVEIAFFSAGVDWRNEHLIKGILCLALGELRYAQLQSTLRIFSRQHLKYSAAEKCMVKDLTLFGHPCENTVIIDDDMNYFKREHAFNVLQILPVRLLSYLVIHQSQTISKKLRYTWPSFIDDIHHDGHFASVNQLFYVTGLLFKALDMVADGASSSLRDALKKLQYQEVVNKTESTKRSWMSRHQELSAEPDYYSQGLKLLQTKNKFIYFMDDDEFLGHYKLRTCSNPREIKFQTQYEKMLDTIENYLTLSPRVKHGLFAGKLPRPLREIEDIVHQLDNDTSLTRRDGLRKIIRIAHGLGPYHPIERAAEQCYSSMM